MAGAAHSWWMVQSWLVPRTTHCKVRSWLVPRTMQCVARSWLVLRTTRWDSAPTVAEDASAARECRVQSQVLELDVDVHLVC